MTELKPLDESSIYKIAHIIAETNDGQVGAYTPKALELAKEIVKHFGRPQSLTEKVKLEPLDIQEVQRCIVEDKEAIKWTNIENGNYWPLANAICQRFGKQSINQASQEDIANLLGLLGRIYCEDAHKNKEMDSNLMVDVADAILKEYILVKR